MLNRILVAVDGSAASLHAARMALDLCRGQEGAELTLAHVVPPVFLPPDLPYGVAPWTEEAVQAGQRLLDECARELGHPELKRVNLTGSPAERLVDYAAAEKFDLLVVGSKGRNAVSRVLIGSVTDRIVHISKGPVLVVR